MNVNFNYPSIRRNRTEQSRTQIAVKAQNNPSFGTWMVVKPNETFPKPFMRALKKVMRKNPEFNEYGITVIPTTRINQNYKNPQKEIKRYGFRFEITFPGANKVYETKVLMPKGAKKNEILKGIKFKIEGQEGAWETDILKSQKDFSKSFLAQLKNFLAKDRKNVYRG